jgi:hypothetical protein
MNRDTIFLLSLVILFPCISGLIRWKQIRQMYQPFLILMFIGTATELLNYFTNPNGRQYSSIINVFSLVEWFFIIAQFYYWRYYSHTRVWYPYIGLVCLVLWFIEILFIGHFTEVAVIFRLASAFLVITLAINEINYIIINESRELLKNARFLICTGFLIYFLYQLLLEGFIKITADEKDPVAGQIMKLSFYNNAFVNVIYGIAIWFIPKKIPSMLRKPDS